MENLECALENALKEVNNLKKELAVLITDKMVLAVKMHALEEQRKEAESRADENEKEVEAQVFLNSVLEQKNDELSHQLSRLKNIRITHSLPTIMLITFSIFLNFL